METGDGHNPVFEDDVTIKSDGWASLRQGEFRKTLKIEPGIKKTLRGLLYNGADDFYIGGVYQKNAKEQTEISANGENYVTIGRGHTHDYDNTGKCKYCDAEAEAKLYFDDNGVSKSEFGSFTTMLTKPQDYENSNLVLWKDSMLYSDATVTKGKFYISGSTKRLQSNGTAALVISGGDVQITEITVDRLKVTGEGKLTLNGGKYYAIDVTDSTYANYGQLLPGGYAFKTSSGWEAKGDIIAASFVSDTAKEVKILPLRSVTISADGETTVPYGTSVKFTATVESNSSSGVTYKWYRNGVAIQNATTNTLVANEPVGDYTYRCDVNRDGYTLSSNTVQLTVQRIDLSDAVLSATIQTRAYDGTTSATVTSSSIGSSGLRANTDYTISSAEFEDKNAGEGKKVTVKVTLTNPNYCFGYDANKRPIMEKTFETTGTITQDTTPKLISKDENIYNSAANTYEFDLDSYLTAIKDDLGTMSYGMPEPHSLQNGIGTPVLEGHTLKLPVSAIRWASETSLGRITIPVNSQNYANVSIEICLKLVERTAVTASATPSKTELTYGEKLDTIALSGTTDPMIPGTFAWQTPDAILDAGRHADLVWKFIPADYTYAEASGTAEITVKQAKLTDPAPVTLTIYNGWAGTYEAALPELPALAEGLRFGNDADYGPPVVSADEYYSSGATLKMVGGKQGVSIPILKNETAKEGKVGTITVQYTSQNYEPVTLAINLVAKNRTAPTFILTADHDTLSGGGKVTLTLERGNLPDGAVVTVSGTDEAGNAVTMTDNGDGTYSATLPNKTQTYTFIAAYDGSQTIAPKTDFTTVKVQQRSSGGGEPAKPSFPVKIANSGDGVAKVDKSYASAGAKVTITVTPGRNGSVQRITVTDEDGERLKLTENRDGTYSFTMPNGAANVYARFSGSGLPFADVPSGSWYYDDIAYVYDAGLMTGLTATAFGPNLSNTRGMIVTILWRMENEPAAKHGCPFADVRRGSYYEQAIAWASENGIVTGFDASTFAPDRAITREQLAAILFRFAAYRGMDAVTLRENLSSFQDQAAISAYAVSALNWAVGEGLMQGTGDKLEPTGNATRAQVAAMLRRFMQRNF
ncbi:S-layer homology domain-containing protein [Sutterella wadsworthensis]|uniref:S-layer homology domain-containing protein n=1 Tax=Sutterella wadsworthensis TaxID=40545 RepID=UPI003AB99DC2